MTTGAAQAYALVVSARGSALLRVTGVDGSYPNPHLPKRLQQEARQGPKPLPGPPRASEYSDRFREACSGLTPECCKNGPEKYSDAA